MKALRRMREGLAGTTKKRAREEMTSLLRGKRKNTIKVAWRHKFVCLAFRNQERVPVTDYEKEELRQAGLGEKLIEFDTLEMTQKQFKDHLIKSFPQLGDCGGFQLLKCMFMYHYKYITSEVSYLSISVDYTLEFYHLILIYVMIIGIPNTRKLELLSMSVHTSPALLKERVGTSRTYIRPAQRDIDIDVKEEQDDDLTEVLLLLLFMVINNNFCV